MLEWVSVLQPYESCAVGLQDNMTKVFLLITINLCIYFVLHLFYRVAFWHFM